MAFPPTRAPAQTSAELLSGCAFSAEGPLQKQTDPARKGEAVTGGVALGSLGEAGLQVNLRLPWI